MPVQVSYPGVYVEEDASLSFSVPSGATAIPVFVGHFYSLDGESPTGCVAVNDWLAFERQFVTGARPVVTITSTDSKLPASKHLLPSQASGAGDLDGDEDEDEAFSCTVDYPPNWAAYALRHYFDNGGGRCYVLALNAITGDLTAALQQSIQACPDITLLCYCDWPQETGKSDGSGSKKAQSDNEDQTESEDSAVYQALNTLLVEPGNYFLLADSEDGTAPAGLTTEQSAVYYPALQTRYRRAIPADEQVVLEGADSLISGITEANRVITLADLRAKTENAALCERIDAALVEAIQPEVPIVLRASPAVAGLYAKTDRTRGVWKAPANVAVAGVEQLVQVSLDENGVSATPVIIDNAKSGELNTQGINALRTLHGEGTLVWGARTLASTSADTKWRYIPVRRLFNAAERDMRQALRAVMFEPNHAPTWQKVRAALENYLHTLWRLGALQGAKPEQAYRVQVGLGQTMTPDDIVQGKMIVQVGMAAVRPAEFIVLQFMQWQGGSATGANQ